jgi:hypothetical protein
MEFNSGFKGLNLKMVSKRWLRRTFCGLNTVTEEYKEMLQSIYPVCRHRLLFRYLPNSGPDSVAGIATGYGLDGPDIEYRFRRDYPHLSRPALGPIHPPGYRVFPRGKERPGRDADPSPPSSAVGHERVELYLSPYSLHVF